MNKKEQKKMANLFWKGFKFGVIPGTFVALIALGASPLTLIIIGLPLYAVFIVKIT